MKVGEHLKKFSRRYVQLITAVLYNCNVKGFATGTIWKGGSKGVCVPGLNCYSCPGAIASCPLGSFQTALVSSRYKFPYYILGTLLLMGLFLGRFICGFLCPFGMIQEFLHKIPTPKLEKSRFTRIGQLEFSLSHMCLWHIWGDLSPLTSKKQDCPALSRAPKVRRSRSLDFAGQSCYCSPITLACKVISSF